ncbi:DUF1616 domain-containing protein [Natronolimnobius baerhuensis]|uniref:DUF1616 domain-containing protein n=1 Tax=Natronolimnobius baerhuensis TaxID=253108 RepID=A0A202ECQ1_9EURY|nr:DUF1616 domain-containing protein [Natronolimnobius baerhuensis]OVE85958.1 hypothetical protein B2G88_03900 [Natronolimnobius baerhuensis]
MTDRSPQPSHPSTAVRQGGKHVLGQLPTDLITTAGFVIVAAVLLAVVDIGSPVVRAALGFPLLFLAPGYATVSMLFPRRTPARSVEETGLIGQVQEFSDLERLALAFGLSVGLIPLLGLGIAVVSLGFTQGVVVAVVSGYTLLGVCVASIRRIRVPRTERYQFSLSRRLGAIRTAILGTNSTVQAAANVVLVASLLIALTSVGYALADPQSAEEYTDLQLLAEDDAGELVAANYTSTVESGESIPFAIGLENQEGESTEYTAVIQEQWISDGEVFDRTDHDRTDYQLEDGETVQDDISVTPDADSGDVRIAVLLYDDEVPDEPSTENAYRYGYVWTEITDDIDADDD